MIRFKQYQEAQGINASFLKACLQGQYQGYKYLHDKKEPSSEMIFGSALHHYLLERDTFEQHYAVMPKFDRRTKIGKEQSEAFWNLNQDKAIIDSDELEKIIRISDRAKSIKQYSNLASRCAVEKSYFADFADGYRYKARLDMVDESDGIIVDIKSTRSADKKQFLRDIINLGYDVQFAHYSNMVNENGNKVTLSLIIAIEKDSEQIAFYDITDIVNSEFTQKRYQRAINTAHEVLTLHECPNKYPETITKLMLPLWAEGGEE